MKNRRVIFCLVLIYLDYLGRQLWQTSFSHMDLLSLPVMAGMRLLLQVAERDLQYLG